MSRKNERVISGLSKEEVSDKYLRLYDEHNALKLTARAQEDRIKRLASKVIRLADDKKKLQKSASHHGTGIGTDDKVFTDGDDFMDELNDKIEKLEKENNQLIKKVDEYKQRYLEAQKGNKMVTAKVDSGLGLPNPSAGPRRTTSGGSLRRTGLRRVETKSESKLNSKSNHTLEVEHRLSAALEENNNMLEAITVLQKKFAEAEAEKYQLKRQIDQKNEMISFSHENNQTLGKDLQNELTKSRGDIRRLEQSLQSLDLQFQNEKSKSNLLDQKLRASNIAHQTALDELDSAQRDYSGELQKVSKLQAERRAFLTLKEEIEIEKEAKRDLANENTLIKEQLERAVRADQSGSQIWKDRESQFQNQIRQLEDSIGSDAKDIQRLRLDLHQERMKSKRLALKLEETEVTVQRHQNMPANATLEAPRSPIREVDLNVKTAETGNSAKELEISLNQMRRRNKQLENKLATLYIQLKDKDEALKQIHEEYHLTKTNLERANFEKAMALDQQNERLNVLENSIDTMAGGSFVPDVAKHRFPKDESIYRGLATGENIISVQLNECTLLRNDSIPRIFCLIEFYQMKPQTTTVKQGLSVNFEFKGLFKVEANEMFLDYLATGFVRIELREVVVGATHRLRAEAQIPLTDFLSQKMKFGGKLQLNTPSGEAFAGLDYQIATQIPFDNAASLYMTKMNAAGYRLKNSESLSSEGAENTLIIRILRGENFESVFEEELPSCYCLYTFYIYQNQATPVINSNTNPEWNFAAEHIVEQNSNLHRYLQTESIKLIVCDKEDDGEDQEDFLCTGDIELMPLSKNKNISRVVSMVDSEGNDAGNLFVQLKWKYPYKKRSKPVETQKPIIAGELLDHNEIPKKKKTSARKSLENYLGERASEVGSIKSAKELTPEIQEEPVYVTPPPKSPTPSSSPSNSTALPAKSPTLQHSPTPQPSPTPEVSDMAVELDESLPADKTLPPEPDEEVNESPEETTPIDEQIREDIIPDDTQSIHSVATETSGVNFIKEKPISDTVSSPRGSINSVKTSKNYTPAVIQIDRLEVIEDAAPRDNNVFIEFDFCGEVEETNASLPFPTLENPSHFDFKKEFNFKHGGSKYNHLYSMLLPHESASSSIKFTLVDDPGDNEAEDCQELGIAYIDIKRFLTQDDFESERIIFESDSMPVAAMFLDLKIKATLDEILADIN